MPSHKASLKLWLRLQCQMITHTTAGILVKHCATGSDQVMARWPDTTIPDAAISNTTIPDTIMNDVSILDAARQVLKKQRLHLNTIDEELLLGQPIVVDGILWGSIVLRINSRDKVDVQATVRLLQWGMTWLQFLLYQRRDETLQDETPSLEMLDLFASILKEASLEESAITLVNKLAARLKSERVSLGLCNKHGVDLVAVSYTASFDKRTQAIRAISDAMLEAIEQRFDIHVPSLTTEITPDSSGQMGKRQLTRKKDLTKNDDPVKDDAQFEQIRSSLILRSHEHLQQSQHLAGVHTFLLRQESRVLGALTIEANQAKPLSLEAKQWVEQNLSLLARIFYLKNSASTGVSQGIKSASLLFLQRWFGYSHLRGKLVTTAAAVFLLLLILPADYRVYSDAVVENTNKHVLVAPQDGYLGVINARPGDAIKKDAVLAQLSDDVLTLERRKLAGQLQQYRQEYDNALATSNRSQAAIASAQVEQAAAQFRLVEQQLERTKLTAPIDGVVVSDDIRQSQGAPVKQGDVLFEIASEDDYLVQLYVDERDITAIKLEQAGRLSLTSLPGEFFDFQVRRITPVSEVREGRNYFRVEAGLTGDYSKMRPGMTGSGKIVAGRRALGWIWFHDIWHWLRLFLWL